MDTCYTLITAHSGCENTPPNSMESIVVGMESGADFVEVDVRATKDDLPVLFHDDFLKTESRGVVKISDYTLDQLNSFIKIDLSNGIHIPEIITLNDAFFIAKDFGRELNLDVKDDRCIVPMIEEVKKADMINSVIISGCEYERAVSLKKNFRELQVLLNLNEKMFLSNERSASSIADEICQRAVMATCCGINIQYKYLTRELIQTALKRFLPISIWTLTENDNPDDYLNMGLYSITTLAVSLLVGRKNNFIKNMALTGILPEKI
ncbi:MAG: glycerophosphodiester phosphodiesterase [Spirochaetales bacterium]|nr:glycerophosphodiester phosphodiesterase [Spirochaetales bacterium]